jgi:4-hydroxy-tetrahydrodipicolinate synthase
VNIAPKTALTLSRHPNIVGIKEASGNISQIVELFSLVGDDMAVYSGNDDQIVPLLSMGGKGVVSVLSNVLPKQTVELCRSWFRGDTAQSAQLQCRLLPLIHALFSQVNPIPVKAALARMGYCEDHVRLPLVPMEEPFRTQLYEAMAAWELL